MAPYDEEIVRNLYNMQEMIQKQNTPISIPHAPAKIMSKPPQGIGISDGTVVKFAMIVGVMVIAYMMIKGSSNYSHSGRRN